MEICKIFCKIYSLKGFCVLLFILVLLYACPANGMVIAPGEVDHFDILISDVVVAGEPFIVKIEALDKFDNIITNYNEIGANVEIKIIGRGKIAPDLISASGFKDGVATIDFIYDKAETFTIIARTKVGSWLKPKVLAKKVIKAVKREQVKDVKLLEIALKTKDKEIASLKESLKDQQRSLEKKDKEARSYKEKLDRVAATEGVLKEDIRKLTQAQASLEKELDRAVKAKSSLEDELARMGESRLSLKKELTRTAKALDEAKRNADSARASLEKKIGGLEIALKTKDKEIASLKGSLKDQQRSLEKAVKREEVEEIKVLEREKRLPFDKYTVKIYSAGEKYVILPVGKKDGLKSGMTFTVYRDEEAIAEIKVTELYEDISMADIEKTIGKMKIQNGDIVSLR